MADDITFRNASDLYTDPSLVVNYSDPKKTRQHALELLQEWVEKQGRSWPATLSAVALSGHMRCVYVPYLIVHATVSFRWLAAVDKQESQTVRCLWCGGSGSTYVTKTEYNPQYGSRQTGHYVTCGSCGGSGSKTKTYEVTHQESGAFDDCFIQRRVPDDIDEAMRCGEPDLATATENANRLNENPDISVVRAATCTADDVASRLHEIVSEVALQRAGAEAALRGRVKSVEISAIDYGEHARWVHLYPMWLSRCRYRRRVLAVEVDAHTGRVYVEVPFTVRLKRFVRRAAMAAAAVCAVGIALTLAAWLNAAPESAGVWSDLRRWISMAEPAEGGGVSRAEAPAVDVGSDVSGSSETEGIASQLPPDASPVEADARAPVRDIGSEDAPDAPDAPPAAETGFDLSSVQGPEGASAGGVVGTIAGGVSEVAPPPGAVRVGGAVPRPAKVQDVIPEYPPIARAARVEGIVILEVVIGVDGRVTNARVLRSVPQLDEAAVNAVRQWVYAPTTQDGVPVSVVMTVTVNFQLP